MLIRRIRDGEHELADFQKMMAVQNIRAIVVPAVENAWSAGESPKQAET